jgi:hypothetical protein
MPNDTKTALTVAAAFAAALMVTPAAHADEAPTMQASAQQPDEIQPSPAAIERLEEAAQTAWIWWPWPPRDIWMEVTHVESVKPKTA